MSNIPISDLPVATALSGTDSTPWVVSGTTSKLTWTTLQALLSIQNFITPQQYGAVADGTTDDTVAIQSAIAAAEALITSTSYGGATVYFPPGSYKVTGTLTISKSFVTLLGAGPQASYLIFSNMVNTDWIKVGTTVTATRRQTVSNLGFFGGTGNTATEQVDLSVNGSTLKLVNVFDVLIYRCAMENVLCGIDIGEDTNTINVQYVYIIPYAAAALYGVNWHCPGTGVDRSDVLVLNDVVIAGQWSSATGIMWRGLCNTLLASGLSILQMGKGMVISNPAGSASYYPLFLEANNLEMEGFKTRAIEITGGGDYKIINANISNATGSVSQGNADDYAIYVTADAGASFTRGLQMSNAIVGSCRSSAIYVDSRNLQLENVCCFSSSAAGAGVAPAVRIGANTQVAQISNLCGEQYGGLAMASYALQVDLGAQRVAAVNVDGSYCVTGGVNDLSAGQLKSANVWP